MKSKVNVEESIDNSKIVTAADIIANEIDEV